MIETLHYFTTRGWSFESNNIIKLWNSLSDEDQKVINLIIYLYLRYIILMYDKWIGIVIYLII